MTALMSTNDKAEAELRKTCNTKKTLLEISE